MPQRAQDLLNLAESEVSDAAYVHGYSAHEAQRLYDQAECTRDLLHHDSVFPAGSRVLEVGCGVGAQTVTLAGMNPTVSFTCVDTNEESLEIANELVVKMGLTNVEFQLADVMNLPFKRESFDHVIVCHLLEHLSNPLTALKLLRRQLRVGGTIAVIEGDHGSCYFNPSRDEARAVWRCLIESQRAVGGNSEIGRELYPLINKAEFNQVRVSPRVVYVDHSKPELMEGFVAKTIIPMVEGVRELSFELKFIDRVSWKEGVARLRKVTKRQDGVFCYTFFKGFGTK